MRKRDGYVRGWIEASTQDGMGKNKPRQAWRTCRGTTKVRIAGLGFDLAQSESRKSLLAMPSQSKVTTEGSYPLARIRLRKSLGVSPVPVRK